MATRRLGSRAYLGEGKIIELIISLDQYLIFLTLKRCKASGPHHPRIASPVKPSISSTVEIEARHVLTAYASRKGLNGATLMELGSPPAVNLTTKGPSPF
jgi:hypothetical protein